MLNWLKRKEQEAPTWRAWFAIPTKAGTAPEWVPWLEKQNKGITGGFNPRSEAPPWIFEGTFEDDKDMVAPLQECQGLATMSVGLRGDTPTLRVAERSFSRWPSWPSRSRNMKPE